VWEITGGVEASGTTMVGDLGFHHISQVMAH
jgi:hypothetical protein